MNRRLEPRIETVFMMAAEDYSYVSSRLVKEVYSARRHDRRTRPALGRGAHEAEARRRLRGAPPCALVAGATIRLAPHIQPENVNDGESSPTEFAASPFPVSENVARMRPSSTLAAMQAAAGDARGGRRRRGLRRRASRTSTRPSTSSRPPPRRCARARPSTRRPAGRAELQQAIIGYYEREFGATYEPRRGDGDGRRQAGDLQRRRDARRARATRCSSRSPTGSRSPRSSTSPARRPSSSRPRRPDFVLTAEQVAERSRRARSSSSSTRPRTLRARVIPPAEFERIMRGGRRARRLRRLRRVLPALRLPARAGLQRGERSRRSCARACASPARSRRPTR